MFQDPCIAKAMHWQALDDRKVTCRLCAHNCTIADGHRGVCGVRENFSGELKTLVYGRLVAERPDPVEKKPLYHFLPGSLTHSVATAGCNMRCANCQNYAISQTPKSGGKVPGEFSPAGDVVRRAVEYGASSVSCTYTEPTIFMEYALDLMREARAAALKTVFVSNGFMSREALGSLGGALDAANIDLKSMKDEFYRRICGARLEPVLKAIAALKEMGVWIEITTLVIPGENDTHEELREIARFIGSLDPNIPWHVSAFHPDYKMLDKPPTPLSTIDSAVAIGREEGLRFVYQGNTTRRGGENTTCPKCGKVVINRQGHALMGKDLTPGGKCGHCGKPLPGIFV